MYDCEVGAREKSVAAVPMKILSKLESNDHKAEEVHSMERIQPTNPFKFNLQNMKKTKQSLMFSPNDDFAEQRTAISKKLRELISMQTPLAQCTPIVEAVMTDDPRFDEIRMVFESEPGFFIPAHLVYPKSFKDKLPLVICLQGHSPGMHVSLARKPYPSRETIEVEGDRDFCIQAVARGYAALALEQRGFGELGYEGKSSECCHDLVWQAALMGKTLLGQRIYDISNAITAVSSAFDFIDADRIGVMGNSGGGTSSYYASCLDERIKVSMPSSSFCSVADAWGGIHHCDCSYIVGMLKYFEMADASILIAPRYLIAVNGIYDHIQPFESAKSEFERVKSIFAAAGAADNCRLVIGAQGHRFYADIAWDVFDDFINR